MQKAQNIDTPTVNLRVKIVGGMATTAGEACKLTTYTRKDGYIVIFHWEDDCREKSDSTTAIRPTTNPLPPLSLRKILQVKKNQTQIPYLDHIRPLLL